ncbi:MAG TPA: AI-2E family transporter [Thermoanaerobaculia bacterium]|nr:AI-2E family transporter [Thermoanaerobaculia bacterium]
MEIRAATAVRVTAIVFGVLIVLRFLWIAHAIFIVTFLGILLGLAVTRAVDLLEKVHVKRGLAAPLVLLLGLGALIGTAALVAPSLMRQTRQLSSELPKLVDQADRWLQQTPAKALVQPPPPQQAQQGQQPQKAQQRSAPPQQQQGQKDQQQHGGLHAQLGKEMRGSLQFLFPIVTSIFGAVGGFVLVIFIAMYVAADPGVYRAGVLHLVPHHNRERAKEWVETLGSTLRQWLVARLIAMVLIGVITGGALALLKVKGAAALGLLAGLLEFVPFFGPIASAVPAIGIALLDSPQKAFYVVLLYLVVQQLEGNVITPLLLEKRLDIPPILTVVAVAALGMVFGVIGMLIAEPLLAVTLVTTKMLYVNDVVGDDVKVGAKE